MFLAVFAVYFALTGASGSTDNSGNKTVTCDKIVCVTDAHGNPVPNQSIHAYDINGTEVASGTTGKDGCVDLIYTFKDGVKYRFCDLSVACVTNCKTVTVTCSTPGITMFDCGN